MPGRQAHHHHGPRSRRGCLAAALADFARERLARYKVPKRFVFRDLLKTSTGKIQKNVLRDLAGERPEN